MLAPSPWARAAASLLLLAACRADRAPDTTFPLPACGVESSEPTELPAWEDPLPSRIATEPFRLTPVTGGRWTGLVLGVAPPGDATATLVRRFAREDDVSCPDLVRVPLTGTLGLDDGTPVLTADGWVQLHLDGSLESFRLGGQDPRDDDRRLPARAAIWSLVFETLPPLRSTESMRDTMHPMTRYALRSDAHETALALHVQIFPQDGDLYHGPLLIGRAPAAGE